MRAYKNVKAQLEFVWHSLDFVIDKLPYMHFAYLSFILCVWSNAVSLCVFVCSQLSVILFV